MHKEYGLELYSSPIFIRVRKIQESSFNQGLRYTKCTAAEAKT